MNSIFNSILNIISGTPLWVWFVLCYLIAIGIKATKRQKIYLPKLFIIPFILIAIKYKMFIGIQNYYMWVYLVSLFVSCTLGYIFAMKEKIKIIKKNQNIELPGSYQKLTLLIIFFIFQYIFGYLHATNPVLAAKYLYLEIAIIGLFPGYFLGKTLNYLKRYVYRN